MYTFKFQFTDPLKLQAASDHHTDILSFEYESYEEALKEAKFYMDVFLSNVWTKRNTEQGLNLSFQKIFDETSKIANSFELIPNESIFNFEEFAKFLAKMYKFRDELELLGIYCKCTNLLIKGRVCDLTNRKENSFPL